MHIFLKKTILVTNKDARKALQIGYSHKGSISVHEWAVLKEAIAVTQTKPREIHWVCSSNQGWLHSRALPRDTTAMTSLWTQNDSAAATEPAALFSTRHRPRKGGTCLLVAPITVLGFGCEVSPTQGASAEGMVMACVQEGYLSSLNPPLPQPLSSFWLPHPTSPSFSLSSWPPWDEKLCPTTCSLPCYFASAWTQQQWSLSGEQKKKEKKNPYVVLSSFLSPREKAD